MLFNLRGHAGKLHPRRDFPGHHGASRHYRVMSDSLVFDHGVPDPNHATSLTDICPAKFTPGPTILNIER